MVYRKTFFDLLQKEREKQFIFDSKGFRHTISDKSTFAMRYMLHIGNARCSLLSWLSINSSQTLREERIYPILNLCALIGPNSSREFQHPIRVIVSNRVITLLWNLFDRTSVTRWLECLFNIFNFSTMKICPIAYKMCQNLLKIMPNTKWTLSKWPKLFNGVPKWWNFAKYGLTGSDPDQRYPQ